MSSITDPSVDFTYVYRDTALVETLKKDLLRFFKSEKMSSKENIIKEFISRGFAIDKVGGNGWCVIFKPEEVVLSKSGEEESYSYPMFELLLQNGKIDVSADVEESDLGDKTVQRLLYLVIKCLHKKFGVKGISIYEGVVNGRSYWDVFKGDEQILLIYECEDGLELRNVYAIPSGISGGSFLSFRVDTNSVYITKEKCVIPALERVFGLYDTYKVWFDLYES